MEPTQEQLRDLRHSAEILKGELSDHDCHIAAAYMDKVIEGIREKDLYLERNARRDEARRTT